jgi:hypothetical protein
MAPLTVTQLLADAATFRERAAACPDAACRDQYLRVAERYEQRAAGLEGRAATAAPRVTAAWPAMPSLLEMLTQ